MTEPNDEGTTPDGKSLDDLTVDPRHEAKDEPGGEDAHDSQTVPGLDPEGGSDLGVPDDPGTGGPGTDDE